MKRCLEDDQSERKPTLIDNFNAFTLLNNLEARSPGFQVHRLFPLHRLYPRSHERSRGRRLCPGGYTTGGIGFRAL